MHSTPETREVAQKVLDYFLTDPRRHDQSEFFNGDYMNPTDEEVCGTTLCVAGAAVYLTGGYKGMLEHTRGDKDWEETGASVLGLTTTEANGLFMEVMDNSVARDMVAAVAQGDETKFNHLYQQYLNDVDED